MTFGATITRAVLTGSVAWLAFGSPGFAGDLSQQEIIERLMPHMPAAPRMERIVTRSLPLRRSPIPSRSRAGRTRPWSMTCVTAAIAR